MAVAVTALALAVMLAAAVPPAAQDIPRVSGLDVNDQRAVVRVVTAERGRVRPAPIRVRGELYRWSCARPASAGPRTIACVILAPTWLVRYVARDRVGRVFVVVRRRG